MEGRGLSTRRVYLMIRSCQDYRDKEDCNTEVFTFAETKKIPGNINCPH